MAKDYKKTIVTVNKTMYDAGTKTYKGEVETKFYGKKTFSLTVFDQKKETQNGGVIAGNLFMDGEQIGIRENDNPTGGKNLSGTIEKGFFRVSIKATISRDEIKTYNVTFTELDDGTVKDDVDNDLPF